MSTQDRITLHSVADLKNHSDDAIQVYLNSLKFKQSYTLSDIRLVVGYILISISAATFVWDYKFGFESTKIYTAIAVAIYTILNGFLTFWISYVQKGIIYTGTNHKGDTIQISSSVEKYVPIYNLEIITCEKNNPKTRQTKTLKKPFNHWFNGDGYLVPLPLKQILACNVPLIGQADPKSAGDCSIKNSETWKLEFSADAVDKQWTTILAQNSGFAIDESPTTEMLKARKKKSMNF